MDNYVSKIKEIFLKIKNKKILYIKKGIDPSLDWSIFISSFLLVFVVGLSIFIYFYSQINSGDWLSQNVKNANGKLVKINQDLLDQTINDIKNKQSLRDNIGKNVPADPSI